MVAKIEAKVGVAKKAARIFLSLIFALFAYFLCISLLIYVWHFFSPNSYAAVFLGNLVMVMAPGMGFGIFAFPIFAFFIYISFPIVCHKIMILIKKIMNKFEMD